MSKQQSKEDIDRYIKGQGNQAGLEKLAEILHALNTDTEAVIMSDVPYITTISALETIEMTAEEATNAGFSMDVIMQLTRVVHPTIKFSDMVVTFNAYEVISDQLSIWSTIIYDAPTDSVYHCSLYLYYDGRIFYNVELMQH